jgi:hypothetical protein
MDQRKGPRLSGALTVGRAWPLKIARACGRITRYTKLAARFFIFARWCAVAAAITWHTHPSRPPVPIHIPGVTINQKIPRRKSPL